MTSIILEEHKELLEESIHTHREKNVCINLTLYWFKLNKLAY